MFTEKQIGRFWNNVNVVVGDSNACWNWKLCVDRYGYGKTKIAGNTYGSHRVAYAIEHGGIPNGKHILHSCDNPICCNPNHLREGNHIDNMQDMKTRGRMGRVGRKYNKLNINLANELREDFKSGMSKHAISNKYGISCIHVRDVIRNKYWKTA